MYQRLFDESIGTPPVSTVDVEAIMRRQRRRARLLRVGAVGGSATAVLAGSLAVAMLVGLPATRAVRPQHLLGSAGPDQAHATVGGAKNILVVGIDARPDQGTSQLARADSITIVHIPAGHASAYLVSIPRDTLVDIPAYSNGKHAYPGGKDKINAAFAYGAMGLTGDAARGSGFALLARTLRDLTGITFDAGAVIDFQGFQQVVSALGGVDMCVDEKTTSIHLGYKGGKLVSPAYQLNPDGSVSRPLPGVTPVVYDVGCRHLAAWQALDYIRQSQLLANLDGEYGRQRHEQQFLKAVFKQLTSSGTLTDPVRLAGVLSALNKSVTVDDGGVPIQDWLYAMRGIGADDLIATRTNGGAFNSRQVDGRTYEVLSDASRQFLRAVRDDDVQAFLSAHPDWVVSS